MFIGHIPAGYLTYRLLAPALARRGALHERLMFWGVLGAILPDLDLLYFYGVDHRQHHHHSYFTHFPLVWIGLLCLSAIWLRRNVEYGALALLFSLGGFIHLVLDTLVGDIWWFAPFVDRPYVFFTVAAIHEPWWLNFVLHWSFALELLLVVAALVMWRRTLAHSD